jgi:hypothetical protein
MNPVIDPLLAKRLLDEQSEIFDKMMTALDGKSVGVVTCVLIDTMASIAAHTGLSIDDIQKELKQSYDTAMVAITAPRTKA